MRQPQPPEQALANHENVEREFLTEREVATLLAVKPETLAVWRHRRVGPPFVRLGPRTPRYRRSEVLAWVDEKATATGQGR